MAAATVSSTPFRFLDLPREIRNNIYTRLYPKAGMLVHASNIGKYGILVRPDQSYSSTLRLVSRQTNQEYLEVLAEDGALFLQDLPKNAPLANVLPEAVLNLTRRITIIGKYEHVPDLSIFRDVREVAIRSYDFKVSVRLQDEQFFLSMLDVFDNTSHDGRAEIHEDYYFKSSPIEDFLDSSIRDADEQGWIDNTWESTCIQNLRSSWPPRETRMYDLFVVLNLTFEFVIRLGSDTTQHSISAIHDDIEMMLTLNIDTQHVTDRRFWYRNKEINLKRAQNIAKAFSELAQSTSDRTIFERALKRELETGVSTRYVRDAPALPNRRGIPLRRHSIDENGVLVIYTPPHSESSSDEDDYD